MAPCRSWILSTNPRSGSTLLCRMLRDAGVAGHPESWFHRPALDDQAKGAGATLDTSLDEATQIRAVLKAVTLAGRGQGNMFALRLMHKSLPLLLDRLKTVFGQNLSDHHLLDRAFDSPRHVRLIRRDSLARAISLIRAEQTGLWHKAPDGTEIERLAPDAPPRYDRARIARQIAVFEADNAAWDHWFARHDLRPLIVDYEDLAQDPVREARRVLDHLGLDPAVGEKFRPGVAKLADDISADWAATYRAQTT